MSKSSDAPMRRIVPLTGLGLILILISSLCGALRTDATTPSASVVAAVTAITAADPPNAAHPYSDPIWSPLRTPARVSCVRTNCAGPYHGYWAIDFIGSLGDPLYAAGAGIFHIGGINKTCSTTQTAATWVWIDHGGGRTTRYLHLDTILSREGQLVTPMTKIGTMGHSGYKCSARPPNYLHMEYRMHGMTGPRLAPGAMLTCVRNGSRISMPLQGLLTGTLSDHSTPKSYPTWNDVPTNTNGSNAWLPTATNDCLATSRGAATPGRPIAGGRRGPGSATISWGVVPAGVGHTIVTIEQWHPSLGRYGNPVYRAVAGRTSATKFTGLLNGRAYRFRVTSHNGAGYSAWSSYATVVPAAPPSAPRAPRILSTTTSSLRYGWWLPAANGTPITRHVVTRRCLVGGRWTTWAGTNIAAPQPGHVWTLSHNWTGMRRGVTCQVAVRAVNTAGYGNWSKVSRATTLR